MIVLKHKKNIDWYSPEGVAVKKKEIYNKGFPNCNGFLFVTFTLDRNIFESPEEGYIVGTDRFRRMIARLQEVYAEVVLDKFGDPVLDENGQLLRKNFIWCRKLELHKDGFPHWHCVFGIRDNVDFQFVADCWGLSAFQGVDIKRIKTEKVDYLFKYIVKGVHSFGGLPDWILDYKKTIRFWQTSPNFYTKPSDRKPPSDKPKKYSLLKKTLRERISIKSRKLEVMKMHGEKVVYRKTIILKETYKDMIDDLMSSWKIYPNRNFSFYERSVVAKMKHIKNYIEKWNQKTLNQITLNRFSVILSLESW